MDQVLVVEEENVAVEEVEVVKTNNFDSPEKENSGCQNPEIKKQGYQHVSANWINTVLGAGVLGIPNVLKNSGLFMGIISLIVFALICGYAAKLVVGLGKKIKKDSYEDVCYAVFGTFGYYLISISCILFSYGALVTYIVIISQSFSQIFTDYVLKDFPKENVTTVVTIIIVASTVFPLCLLKDLSRLSFTSISSILTFVIIFIMTCVLAPFEGNTSVDTTFIKKNFLTSFGTIAFGFVCLDSVFPVYRTLRDPTMKRQTISTYISMGFLCLLYTSFGIYMFCFIPINNIDSNILLAFQKNPIPLLVTRVLLGVTIIFTYPMSHFLIRSYLTSMFKPIIGKFIGSDQRFALMQHIIITVVLVVSSSALALTIRDLGIVMEVTGSVASSLIGFLIPVLLKYKIEYNEIRENFSKIQNTSRNKYKDILIPVLCDLVLPIFVFIIGLVALFVSTPMSIKLYIDSK